MEYQSTRGLSSLTCGADAVLAGIAPDGGLYLPLSFEKPFDWKALMDKDFQGQAEAVFSWFFDDLPDIPGIVRRAYEGKFSDPEVTPLQKVGDRWVLELFTDQPAHLRTLHCLRCPYCFVRRAKRRSVKKAPRRKY